VSGPPNDPTPNDPTPDDPVLVIGDCIVDETRGAQTRRWPGGAGLNLAVGLRVIGLRSVLAASLGTDPDGDWLRGYLRGHGVGLLALPGALGTGLAVSERTGGEPRYRFNDALRQRRLEFDHSVHRTAARAAAVAVNTFSFDDVEQAECLVELMRRAGRPVVADPNPRPALLRDRSRFRAGFEALMPHTELVKIGDEDVDLLYPGRSLDAVGARMLELGAEFALLTRGDAGATVLTRLGRVDAPASSRPGPVVDTMGAGDATLATILAHLVREGGSPDAESWRPPLYRAMAVAAATCRSHGGLLTLS
jgi:fructokinase